MSSEVESWRAAQVRANEALELAILDVEIAQGTLRRAGEALLAEEIQVEARRAEIAFYQERIDKIEAEELANRPGPEDPTNVPLVPIQPAHVEPDCLNTICGSFPSDHKHGEQCTRRCPECQGECHPDCPAFDEGKEPEGEPVEEA